MDENDKGFTLVELLVVMIIIGILAAIAIPVFMNQRAKARDTSTKADVSTLGKEIATYYVDGTKELAVTAGTNQVTLAETPAVAGGFTTTIKTSTGTASPVIKYTTGADISTGWCVQLTNPDGQQDTYSYSAQNGLKAAAC
jgi:prepilin-type N-terminal cleavage/methylation domain-containing protein